MEEIKIQDLLSTQKDTQDNLISQQVPPPTKENAENFHILIYQPNLKNTPFISALASSEGSQVQSLPYLLPNFSLVPASTEGNLLLELVKDDKTPFGVLGQLIRVKFASLNNLDFHGQNLKDLTSGLKQTGDLKEIQGEEYKYLYKVGDLEDGPVLALTRTNTIFSDQKSQKPDEAVCKTHGGELVENYHKFLSETFDQGVAFLGLNYLKGGFELVVADPFVVKGIFDAFMREVPQTEDFGYTFEKGSTEKLDYEIEVEKFSGANVFKIPELLNATGNFNWNNLRNFTQHHNKAT